MGRGPRVSTMWAVLAAAAFLAAHPGKSTLAANRASAEDQATAAPAAQSTHAGHL